MALVPSPTILSVDEMGRIAPPIFASVGRDGANAPGDVFVIQSLLDDRLPKPHAPVPVTGVADAAPPSRLRHIRRRDGDAAAVRPGRSGQRDLLCARRQAAGRGCSAHQAGHFGQIPPDVADAAVASRKRWAVPASVTIAQWAVESAWGASMPPGSNNPFGIKATATQPAVESPTREVLNGESVTITARFRQFNSLTQAFDEHGRLLATSPVYKDAMKVASDPEAFADALTGTYATDPKYGFTLKWVIENYGLSKYEQ